MRRATMHGTVAGQDKGSAFFDPWLELRAAIVRKAVDDYMDILRKMWKPGVSIQDKRLLLKEKLKLERFFHSRWYDCLCDVPADNLIHNCMIRAKEMEKEAIERKNKQEIKKLLKDAV